MEYRKVRDFVICKLPSDDEINMEQARQIAKHTHNTWEHDRSFEEVLKNTVQGKKAEYIIEMLLKENSSARYLSYDDIRTDKLEKHAPFDGLLFRDNISEDTIDEAKHKINTDVLSCKGDNGKISVSTREYLEDIGIFTIEIKSSRLQNPRDYQTLIHKNARERTDSDYLALCDHIRDFYDYFVYPKHCRDHSAIKRFYEYYSYVKDNLGIYSGNTEKEKIKKLMDDEYDNNSDVFTRVFIDEITNELVIPGYVLKARFFEEPRIMKFYSKKSENALYYVFHMKMGEAILDIDKNDELWNWNRSDMKNNLLCGREILCPTCQNELKLKDCHEWQKLKYFCGHCASNRWYEMQSIHRKNM